MLALEFGYDLNLPMSASSEPMSDRGRRSRPLRFVRAAVGILLGVAGISAAWNQIAHTFYLRSAPPPGQMYIIDGHSMHLYCTGAGTPTIVLEGGLGDTWSGWQQVQPGLSSVTRVCSYDRVGLGFSEPHKGPRDAVEISEQLHQLLQTGGIAKPLLLVGQSAGGLYVRQFAANYSDEVAGLVLIDATPPESFDRIPGARETQSQQAQRRRDAWLQAFEDAVGVSRLLGRCRPQVRPGLVSYRKFLLAEACRPAYEVSRLGEFDDFEASAAEVAHTNFGTLPLLIISQDPDRPKPGWSQRDIAANPIWAALQEQSKVLSTHSRRIIARGSGHRVQNDRPDVVISAISQLIPELRSPSRASQFDRSTVIQ